VGNSGEKRKGRRHLPKVGTSTDMKLMHRRQRREIEHDIGLDPHRGPAARRALVYLLLGIAFAIVVIGALSLWLFT
jgi:hypothetical protein